MATHTIILTCADGSSSRRTVRNPPVDGFGALCGRIFRALSRVVEIVVVNDDTGVGFFVRR